MFKCGWESEWRQCNTTFRKILTEEGVCFTFNMLNSVDIYTE